MDRRHARPSARAAFLDLNGTLVLPVAVVHPREYILFPFTAAAVRLLNDAGFACPVITVQSRISKRIYTEADFRTRFTQLQAELQTQGAHVVGPYLCPHQGADRCHCKKPQTDLYDAAATDLHIDLSQSVVIGDDIADMLAARALGCRSCLVRTGVGERAIHVRQADHVADHVAENVLAAAQWAVAIERR